MTHGAVPIIGPRSLDQLESNLGAAALALWAEQIARLDAASALAVRHLARRRAPLPDTGA